MAEQGPDPELEVPGYEILKELGKGGVSTVYLARHRLLERQVAIKVMSPVLAVEEGFSRRFIREGQTIAQLKDPGIVTVYDVTVAGHRPLIAMEYLPGGSLKDRMTGPIPPEQAISLLRSVAGSLGYAHRHGVFHRDVKPENILFRENGDPVLTDFGIAKSESQDTALTSVGVVVGTPRYISPEQAQGHGCDARSDIYALGVIFHEMLTGRPPYEVKGSMSLLYAHINDPIPRLPEELADYQDLLDALLAKDPDQRVPDCDSLVRRLEDFKSARPLRVNPRIAGRRAGGGRRAATLKRAALLAGGLSLPVVALVVYLDSQRLLPYTQPETGKEFRAMVSALLKSDDEPAEAEGQPAAPDVSSAAITRPGVATTREETAQTKREEEPLPPDPVDVFEQAEARYYGRGVEEDRAAAVRLYEEAAENGHVMSQYFVGVAYGNGDGVERSEERALQWLSRAAQAGVRGAQYNLILGRIFGTDPDAGSAARMSLELAERKYTPVYRILGWMYNTGTGVDTSFTQSVKWNVKTMVKDVTGDGDSPKRVVRHWEHQMEAELNKIASSKPVGGK